jgi:short-subunit dehydrogenase
LLIAHGTLPNQERCQESFELTMREIEINLLGTISLLTHAANYFEQKRSGAIVVITSVAGERGRQSNYVYGAAKGGVSLFLQGLRNRLDKSGVNVLDIKPGFVDTPMTADFPNKGILWSQPHRIARHIIRAIDRRQDIVYVPWFWCFIMMAIRTIPERLFKKLKL